MNVPKDVSIATDNIDTRPELNQEKPIVYLGAIYHDTQQYLHYKEHYNLYKHLPQLVPHLGTMCPKKPDANASHEKALVQKNPSPSAMYKASDRQTHMSYQTRVNVIPSFAPKNQALRNMHQGTTTIALKPEPSIPSKLSNTQAAPFNVSVFSGPHYQPDKYAIKTSTDAEQGQIPDSKNSTPRLDEYFTNALKDGSYFESYSDYHPEDPENFRHAFSVENGDSRLTNVPMKLNDMNQTYTTSRETTQFRSSQTQQDIYAIEPRIKRMKHEQQQRLSSPYAAPQQHSVTRAIQPSSSSSSSPSSPTIKDIIEIDNDLQDERVNLILEAANLLDFSGQITFTTNNDETTQMEIPLNFPGTDVITRVIPSRKWPAQRSDSTGSEADESSDDGNVEEPPSKRDRKGKKKIAQNPESLSDYRRPHRGSVRTAGKTVACVPSATAATSYIDENESSSLALSSSTASPSPSPVESGDVSSDDNDSDEPIMNFVARRQILDVAGHVKMEEKPIPTKALTIIKCRDWGKFLQSWRIKKRPLLCSICLDPIVSSEAPSVVYCDSPQCDVLIHRACLNRTELSILDQKCWLCDKCFFLDTLEQDVCFVVTCALCPNTNGLFCKLSPYLHDIPWVHFICAKMLEANPGDFNYQPDLGEYEARFDLIPLDSFNKKCVFCVDRIYASYGAKLSCTDCHKSFHVTCAQMNGVHISLKSGKARCWSHFEQDESEQQIQRSTDYRVWINLKEAYLLKNFSKDSRMFAIDSWKILAKDPSSFSMGNYKINIQYVKFLHRIKTIHYEVEGTRYSKWINYTLSFFNSVYSARDMETYTVSFSTELFSSHKLIWEHYDFRDDCLSETNDDGNALDDSSRYDDNMGTGSGSKRHVGTEDLIEVINPNSPLLTPPHLQSPQQTCSICKRQKLPAEVCANLGITESYLKGLRATEAKRPPGFTGKKGFWDPRVFIQCSKCLSVLHCGCPEDPIKNHPERNKVFICILCDRNSELIVAPQVLGSRRSRKINYKE